jgi:hypothetical protein
MTKRETHDVDLLFGGLEPPQPPPDVRARALRAAHERLAEPASPDLWSRLWNNRSLRLGWVAAVILLAAGHILVGPAPRSSVTAGRPVDAAYRPDDSMLDILRPLQIDAKAHPAIGRFAAAEDPSQIEIGGNPS